jgi:hypothetical protein
LKHKPKSEPFISIPLSILLKLQPGIRKIIGRKKKLSAKDTDKIARSLFRQLSKSSSSLAKIKTLDDWLEWIEREGLEKLKHEALLLKGTAYARAIIPFAEFIKAKKLREVDTRRYANYDITQLPDDYKKRIRDIPASLDQNTKDKKIIKIIDEFESFKNTERLPA